MLHTVTDRGGAVTRTTRDASGRVRQLDDSDRGTTVSVHDGFGEPMSSTDALGPEGYTWHHHQDGTTMQLVSSNIHRMTGHTGGFAFGRQ
ncbi:HNH endonuclease [Sorangium sp. So ce1014]